MAARLERVHRRAREALQELSEDRVRGREQRVLRRRVAEAREARHVRDERDAGERNAEVIQGHHAAEDAQVRSGVRQHGEVGDDDTLQNASDDEGSQIAEAESAEAAGGDAEQR